MTYLNAKEDNMSDIAAAEATHQLLHLRDDHTEPGLVDESGRMVHLQVSHCPAQAFWVLPSEKHAQIDI